MMIDGNRAHKLRVYFPFRARLKIGHPYHARRGRRTPFSDWLTDGRKTLAPTLSRARERVPERSEGGGGLRPEQFLGLLRQFRAKIRVGDADKRLGTLALGLALQIDNAELGDDEVHVLPGRGQ